LKRKKKKEGGDYKFYLAPLLPPQKEE